MEGRIIHNIKLKLRLFLPMLCQDWNEDSLTDFKGRESGQAVAISPVEALHLLHQHGVHALVVGHGILLGGLLDVEVRRQLDRTGDCVSCAGPPGQGRG